MNLLPLERKDKIQKEKRRRFALVAGVLFPVLFLIALILLLPSFFLVAFEEKNFERQFASLKENAVLKEAEKIESAISELNKKIEFYKTNQKESKNLSPFFYEILKAKPSPIALSSFLFEKGADKKDKIALQGKASDRTAFISFVEALRKNPDFEEVVSPVSNLLKEKDLEFSLSCIV